MEKVTLLVTGQKALDHILSIVKLLEENALRHRLQEVISTIIKYIKSKN